MTNRTVLSDARASSAEGALLRARPRVRSTSSCSTIIPRSLGQLDRDIYRRPWRSSSLLISFSVMGLCPNTIRARPARIKVIPPTG